MTKKKKTELSEILGSPISRQEALHLLKSCPEAHEKFQTFPKEFQTRALEFIQGIRGLPILYDTFFKKILDPYTTPERLEHFLSCLLKQSVKIRGILTREGSQMAEKGSLVIMDILVEIEDGSLINVEMQKHGYDFTGERSACYMSDMIMRQYNCVKSVKKDLFSFKDIKSVYLIVIMEHSSRNFLKVSPHYIHRSEHGFDTGAEMNFLTNYLYISLDTFHSVVQNIDNYMDAWLMFLSSDTPDDILHLVETYPEFKEYYHDIAMFRKKPKELMSMYSEALLKLDNNTVNYMIEEMQKELAEKDNALAEKDNALARKDAEIAQLPKHTASENARKLFENGVSYDIVHVSIGILSEEELQAIYKDVTGKEFDE